MKNDEIENMNISVYWWNMGKKTLEFKGPYKNYLLNQGISVTDITHPSQKDISGWRFTVSMSSTTITIDSYDPDYMRGCDDIIRSFLLIMGDKARLVTPRREYNINW